jgi:hypothetical protein
MQQQQAISDNLKLALLMRSHFLFNCLMILICNTEFGHEKNVAFMIDLVTSKIINVHNIIE